MVIKTRDFGEMEIEEASIVRFVGPIFGFEEYRDFVFLQHEEINPHFVWLQSVEEPMVCFIVANPQDILPDYAPDLSGRDAGLLGEGEYLYWALTVIRDPYYDSTINLKSPIVVNLKNGRAAQVILEGAYSIRHPLVSEKGDA